MQETKLTHKPHLTIYEQTNEETKNGFYIAIGKQGSGKTALITSLAVNEHTTGRVILSNYNIALPHIKIDFISIIELVRNEDMELIEVIAYHKVTKEIYLNPNSETLPNPDKEYNFLYLARDYQSITGHLPQSNSDYLNNAIILIDEIHVYFDAYDFLKKENRLISAFASQLRKRNTLLLATTQYLLALNLRLRKQIKIVFDMKKIGRIFIANISEIDGVYFESVREVELVLSPYFTYYDTTEIIKP